jgi:dTDP-4-dehydrorhamnose reductase
MMQERDTLSVVNDQIGSQRTHDLSAIMDILTHEQWHPGIYNFFE